MTRRITVISTQRNEPKVYNSSAETWGQLRPYIEADFGSLDNMKAVVKETRAALDRDSDDLPDGNCIIMLTQVKIKAGMAAVVDAIAALRARFSKVVTDAVSKIRKKTAKKAE